VYFSYSIFCLCLFHVRRFTVFSQVILLYITVSLVCTTSDVYYNFILFYFAIYVNSDGVTENAHGSKCLWSKSSLGRNVYGAKCPSMGRSVALKILPNASKMARAGQWVDTSFSSHYYLFVKSG